MILSHLCFVQRILTCFYPQTLRLVSVREASFCPVAQQSNCFVQANGADDDTADLAMQELLGFAYAWLHPPGI